jgi:hypothetical protein
LTPNNAAEERAEPCGRVIAVAPDGRIIFPWSRRPGESHQAFDAFVAYRDTRIRGVRSIRRAARRLGKSRQLCERWSRRWSWVARCERFDLAVDRLRQAWALAEITERAAQAARASEAVRYVAIQGGRDALARFLSDENFMLYAGLVLPLEDLVGLVGAEGPPLLKGWAEGGRNSTETQERPDPSLGGGLGGRTADVKQVHTSGFGNRAKQKPEEHDDRVP